MSVPSRSGLGFTLIEPVVVLALLALLVSAAVPQYKTYLGRAQVARALASIAPGKTYVDMEVSLGRIPRAAGDGLFVVEMSGEPNCDHCDSLWRAVRPWGDSGQLQLRYVPVEILAPDSSAKAALLLSSPAPCDSLGEMAGVITTGPVISAEAVASEYWLPRVRFNGELIRCVVMEVSEQDFPSVARSFVWRAALRTCNLLHIGRLRCRSIMVGSN